MENEQEIYTLDSKASADRLIAWVRKYAASRIDSRLAEEKGCFPPHVFLDMGNQGFFGMHVSKSYGGLDLTTYDLLRVLEQIAAIDLTLALLLTEAVQGAHTLEKYASASFKSKYLPQLAAGKILVAGAMTESAAGSHPRAMEAAAISDGHNGYLLNGTKRWVGAGAWASLIAVYTQEFDTQNNWLGMSGFLISHDTAGLHIGAETQTMGIKAIGKHNIDLDHVQVPKEALLGNSGQGMEIAQDNMMYIRLCLAAAAVGAMKRSVQLMYRYANRRVIATGLLLENPVTMVCLTELICAIHNIENLVYLLGRLLDEDSKEVPEEALAAVKVLGSEYLGGCVDKLVQILGARGYEESNGASKLFRDARAFRIFEGPTEALTMYIGSRMLAVNVCFQNFLCNKLQQKELFNKIILTIEEIKRHYQENKAIFFEKPFLLDYWIQTIIGEIVSHGLLLAAIEYTAHEKPSENNTRALEWARKKFNLIVEKSFLCLPEEKILIHPNELKYLIAEYENAIGDIEQTPVSQQILLDPLLQRHSDQFFKNQDDKISIEKCSATQHYALSAADLKKLSQWTVIEKNTAYPNICVHQLFEEQEKLTPQSIAVVYHEDQLTYHELNARANQLANYLIKAGVTPDKVVAIYLKRSLDMIIAVLAILKSGTGYLALDPYYPVERLQYMLKDSDAEIILTHKKLLHHITLNEKKIIFMDEIENLLALELNQNIISDLNSKNLAYLIYTSGSTGKPKGVMLPHCTLTNLICWHKEKINVKRNVLQFTTLNFDMSFFEIFSALSSGGTLVLISESERLNVFSLAKIIKQHAVEQLMLSVPFLQILAESKIEHQFFFTLKEIIVAGEQLKLSPILKMFFTQLPQCKLLNYYGPSETHVVTAYEFPKNPENWPAYPPIGRPITHLQILILDENLQQMPIGMVGEIYIGGFTLSRGYKNNDLLTQRKFIQHIDSKDEHDKLYRTGDFAKYLPDGNIVFLGRKDEQVKISGFRIELKEIEAHLIQYSGVKDAMVLVKDNTNIGKYLEAFFVTDSIVDNQYTEELCRFLKNRLPTYMIPTVFSSIPQMPLTPSGKIDRIALEKMTSLASTMVPNTTKYETDTEKKLINILEDFFKLSVDLNDSFISIGGNSLLAMSIASKLYDKFSVEVPPYILLSTPTISEITKYIDSLQSKHYNDLALGLTSTDLKS